MKNPCKYYLCFTFLILSRSLVALPSDSLKVKKIEYFEKSVLTQIDYLDTLDRTTSRYFFTPMTNANYEKCNVVVNKFLKNTPIILSQTNYTFVTGRDSTYFDEYFIGYKITGVYDSTSRVLKFSTQNMAWDKKNRTNSFLMDSLFKLKIKYKKDAPKQRIEWKYDKYFNNIYTKKKLGGQTNYIENSSYDAKNRVISQYSERNFNERTPDPANPASFYTLKDVREKMIKKVKYDDAHRTSESIADFFRKQQLYAKELFKNWYDEYEHIILQEQYEYKIVKGEQVGEPKLISRNSYIYEKKLLVKAIYEDFKTNTKRIEERKYTFW